MFIKCTCVGTRRIESKKNEVYTEHYLTYTADNVYGTATTTYFSRGGAVVSNGDSCLCVLGRDGRVTDCMPCNNVDDVIAGFNKKNI